MKSNPTRDYQSAGAQGPKRKPKTE
jgi:hypothetical protein